MKHLTPKEIAEQMNVKYRLVLGWIRSKELPAVDLGNGKRAVLRVKEKDLEAFLRKRAYTGESEMDILQEIAELEKLAGIGQRKKPRA